MPPKRRGRPSKNSQDNDEKQNNPTGVASSSASPATPRTRVSADKKGKGKANQKRGDVPDVYQEMLAEALPSLSSPERPLKRRRTGKPDAQPTVVEPVSQHIDVPDDEDVGGSEAAGSA